jgi:hypothetical protein
MHQKEDGKPQVFMANSFQSSKLAQGRIEFDTQNANSVLNVELLDPDVNQPKPKR